MKYQGSCHCGKVAFDVECEPGPALSCNCSICHRKGSLLWFVPRGNLQLRTPESALTTYMFNKHVIKHRFCSTCGVQAFGEGADPKGQAMAAINIRCLDGVDLATVPVQPFDGRSM